MKYFSLAIVLVLNVLLSGCVYLQAKAPKVAERIDLLIEEQRYGHALEIIDYVDPDTPDYDRLMQQKKNLSVLASKLEVKTINGARQLVQKNEWYKAQLLYEQALVKLPDCENLQKHQQEFLVTRNKHLGRLELKLNVNKARWYISTTPVQQEIIRVLPDAEEKYAELKDYRIQKEKTAQHLLQFTFEALDDKEYNEANTLLGLIDRLAVGTLDKKQLMDARQQLKNVSRQRRIQQEKKTHQIIDILKQDYDDAGLRQARQQLDLIESNREQYHSSQLLHTELKQLYQKGIEQKVRDGRNLYTAGNINEALQMWKPLLEIDKTNLKLQTYIARANRVLNKLQRLGKESEVTNPSREVVKE